MSGRVKRLVLAVLGLLALAGGIPVAASALSKKQADAIAMRALAARSGTGNVILFGLPAPLPAGTFVVPADPPRGASGTKATRRVSPLARPAWLYWLDQTPYAKFAHPSRYLLIDDSSGRVIRKANTRWYPSVNLKAPAFLAGPATYDSKRFRVYTRVRHRKAATRRPAGARASHLLRSPPAKIPPGALAGECVLIVADFSDPRSQNDYDAFSSWSRSLGIATFFASGEGASPTIPGSSTLVDGDVLQTNTSELIDKKGCKDIVVYLAGHGLSAEDGPAMVISNNVLLSAKRVSATEVQVEVGLVGVQADDVLADVKAHHGANFKLKVDACYSGRFLDVLTVEGLDGRRVSKVPNLLIAETSSSGTQTSSFGNPALDGSDNPNNVSEFTNQNLTGLDAFFSSEQEVTQAVGEGGSLMAHALDRAFDLGASVNHAVDEKGSSIPPVRFANFATGVPSLKPIHAVFDQAHFTTTYTIAAPGSGLKFAWSVKIRLDEPCAKGFVPGPASKPNQAAWEHKDVSQGGACNHTGKLVGPRGHPGTVTVVVTSSTWTCTATYVGTEGSGGSPEGDGDPPVCKQR